MASLEVATFNVHWGLRHRGGGEVDLLGTCRSLAADVICLQEAWRPRDSDGDGDGDSDSGAAHACVARELGYELVEVRVPRDHNNTAPAVVRAADGDRSWWGLAVLTRYPVMSVEEFPLGSVPFDEAHRVAARVTLDVDGVPFVGVTTHLTWRAWGIPMQLRRLRTVLPDVSVPAFAAGDFNMWGPIVSGALPGWRRAVRGRTWPAPHVRHQLDHILVNRAVQVERSSVEPFAGSDHLPVRATLRY